jgi:hypothetical protein
MRRTLETATGAALYRKRTAMIEPIFGDFRFNLRIERFQRRGRAACLPGTAADHRHPQPLEALARDHTAPCAA